MIKVLFKNRRCATEFSRDSAFIQAEMMKVFPVFNERSVLEKFEQISTQGNFDDKTRPDHDAYPYHVVLLVHFWHLDDFAKVGGFFRLYCIL